METLKKGIGILNRVVYPKVVSDEDNGTRLLLSKNYQIYFNKGTKTAELRCIPLGITYASTRALDKKTIREIRDEIIDLCALYNEFSSEEFRVQLLKDFKVEIDYFSRLVEKYYMKSGEMIENI